MCENRARFLEDPAFRGELRVGVEGDRGFLQKELDLASGCKCGRAFFRATEDVLKKGAFALVVKEEPLAKTKRGPSLGLLRS
jgi:hypothetical protein